MIEIVTGLLGGVWQGLALFGASLAAAVIVYLRGRSAGRAKERARQAEQSLENLRTRDDVEDQNAALGDAAIRDRLRHWER